MSDKHHVIDLGSVGRININDVAYMPVPRCDGCLHWEKNLRYSGVCRKSEDDDGGLSADDAMIVTRQSFGCVQWEAKP